MMLEKPTKISDVDDFYNLFYTANGVDKYSKDTILSSILKKKPVLFFADKLKVKNLKNGIEKVYTIRSLSIGQSKEYRIEALKMLKYQEGDVIEFELVHKSKTHTKLIEYLQSNESRQAISKINEYKKIIKQNKDILLFEGNDSFLFLNKDLVADGTDYDFHSGRNGLLSFKNMKLGNWSSKKQLVSIIKGITAKKIKIIKINEEESSMLNSLVFSGIV